MPQLTEELFPILQSRASLIFQDQDSKEALILGRDLAKALPQTADNPALYQKYQTLTWQLKWLGLSLMQDNKEYSELFRQHFLEGLTMPEGDLNGPAQIAALKISFMFGINVVGFLNEILAALSENKQRIGPVALLIAGEKNLVQPTIKNWLLDFARSAPSRQNLKELSVSNYLFNNANAEKLSPPAKDLLGRLLNFYNDFRQLNKTFTAMEKQLPPIETATAPRAVPRDDQFYGGDSPTGKELYGAAPRGERSELYGAAPHDNQFYGAAPTPTPTITIIQKTLRQLVKDNKDALNQNLTSAPIKITDFDQPVRPTIKNWLVDYVKIKGAGRHESLERGDYLFNNPNARALAEKERALLAEILKAYDDDLPLPINSQDQTILLEKLDTSAPNMQAPPIRQTQPAPNRIASTPNGNYREPISKEDLSGPAKQIPTRPAPRLSGNIIDLSDTNTPITHE